MIIILHGENTKESRNYYFNMKNSAKNPLIFDGITVTLTDLVQAIEGQGLFVDQQEIFIEELLSKRKQSKELENLTQYLNQHHGSHKIILWESKELTPKQLKSIKGEDIKKFDLPKTLFVFLDNLKPNNSQRTIQYFHNTLETEEPEFIFFMIVRQFRILLALSDVPSPLVGEAFGSEVFDREAQTESAQTRRAESHDSFQVNREIDEVKRLAPWQKEKLQKQMQLFEKGKLLQMYNQLFTIEEGMKTGQLAVPLVQAIDFFLVNL